MADRKDDLSRHQPTEAELDEPIVVKPTSFDNALAALTRGGARRQEPKDEADRAA